MKFEQKLTIYLIGCGILLFVGICCAILKVPVDPYGGAWLTITLSYILGGAIPILWKILEE